MIVLSFRAQVAVIFSIPTAHHDIVEIFEEVPALSLEVYRGSNIPFVNIAMQLWGDVLKIDAYEFSLSVVAYLVFSVETMPVLSKPLFERDTNIAIFNPFQHLHHLIPSLKNY